MRTLLLFLSLFIVTGCKDTPSASTPPETSAEALNASEFTTVLAPLIDPAKLDTLKGKRAATPRLRKACYWLQMAHIWGFDVGEVIDQVHSVIGSYEPKRAKAQRESLIRNRVILERLGCIDEAGMIKLRKGNAPTITKGPYAGEIVTGDHIIPRSVCPELDTLSTALR